MFLTLYFMYQRKENAVFVIEAISNNSAFVLLYRKTIKEGKFWFWLRNPILENTFPVFG